MAAQIIAIHVNICRRSLAAEVEAEAEACRRSLNVVELGRKKLLLLLLAKLVKQEQEQLKCSPVHRAPAPKARAHARSQADHFLPTNLRFLFSAVAVAATVEKAQSSPSIVLPHFSTAW